MATPRSLAFALLGAAFVAWLSSCVTAPVHRPIGPPIGDRTAELGIAPGAMFGEDEMGVGASGWAAWQVHPEIDIIARGFGSDVFTYDGNTPLASDVLAGGGLGLRGRYTLFPNLLVGAEAFIEYNQRTGGAVPERLVTIIGGVPVAEEAFPGFWVYTDIQLGLAIPLQKDPRGPFFGIQEIPLGVAWQVTPWFMLVAEGGFAVPVNGGYGSVGVAFRL